QLDLERLVLRRRGHGEREEAPVGRPGDARRRFGEVTDCRGRVAVEPVHEQLLRGFAGAAASAEAPAAIQTAANAAAAAAARSPRARRRGRSVLSRKPGDPAIT